MKALLLAFLLLTSPDIIAERLPAWVELYRWFHAHPELSLKEFETSARMAEELRTLGLEVTPVGGTGLVAVLEGNSPGRTVLYRVDMDALPVEEATGLAYASQNPGVMHACGHDIHMSVGLGVMDVLSRTRDEWSGRVVFVAQPAEELGLGAKAILADPSFARVAGKPDLALAFHDLPSLPAGTVELTPGYSYANVDSVDIVLHGKGTHGARPQLGIDPIVMGAELVGALQTIVSRRMPPGTRAVVTVGSFVAGKVHNVIPPSATLLLTVRSYGDKDRATLLAEIRRVTMGISQALGAPREPEITVRDDEFTPSVYNDPEWVERLAGVISEVATVVKGEPFLIGEDFSRYSRELGCPGVMMGLGAVDPARIDDPDLPGLHSDRWAPAAEPTIATGVRVMLACIRAGLKSP